MAIIDLELPSGEIIDYEVPDDWTDEQISASIRKNFPSEQKQERKGHGAALGEIATDILGKTIEAPGEIGKGISALAQAPAQIAPQVLKNQMRLFANLLVGANLGGRKALNIPSNIAKYFEEKGLDVLAGVPGANLLSQAFAKKPAQELISGIRIPEGKTEFEKKLLARLPTQGKEADELVQGLGEYILPGMIPGGAGAKFLTGALMSSGEGENPIAGGAMFALPEAGIKTAKKIKSMDLTPSGIAAQIGESKISPEKLEANLRAADEMGVPLGRILESPALNTLYEAYSSVYPFAGGTKYLGELKEQVQKAGEQTLESLKPPDVTGDLNFVTKDLLVDAFQKQLEEKNNLYAERNNIAKSENFNLELPNFQEKASEIQDVLKESALYRTDSKFRSSFDKLLGYEDIIGKNPELKSKILDAQGNPIVLQKSSKKMPSLTDAQTTANNLERIGSSYLSSPEPNARFIGGKYKDVAKSLRKDIKDSIEKNGSEKLKSAQKEADKNFAENFVPFLDDHIYDILQKDYDPQSLVQEIIKPSKTHDKFSNIAKIKNLLPENKKNVLGYSYLKSRSLNKKNEFSPQEYDKALKALGTRQFEELFSKDDQLKLLDYQNLKNMSGKALDVMNIPKTGFGAKELGFVTALTTAVVKDPSLMSSLGLLSPIIPAKYLNKVLTNPEFRQKVVNKIREKNQLKENERIKGKTSPLEDYFIPELNKR